MQIELFKKGDKARTARHADVMNEIVKAVNGFLAMTVSPPGLAWLVVSEGNIVLTFDPAQLGSAAAGATDLKVVCTVLDEGAGEITAHKLSINATDEGVYAP